MDDIYIPGNDGDIPSIEQVGGKARNLTIMQRNGILVPDFFVLTTAFFEKFAINEDILEKIDVQLHSSVSSLEAVNKISETLQQLIFSTSFSDDLHKEIKAALSAVSTGSENCFSVRSSAVDEDGKKFSFAGQLESFLYVEPGEILFSCIQKCFASAFSERVMAYRFHNNLPFNKVRPAVVIQKMIFGEISGVMFTGNPLNNNPDQTLINATYGIGEGIVSGELDSDMWVVDEQNTLVKKQITVKNEQIVFCAAKGSGTVKEDVAGPLQKKESLSDETILELTTAGRKIEQIFGSIPQDIEFCIKKNQLYFLQSRPVTTLSHIDKSSVKTIFDNSNIVESFPGTTSPLTFSFASMVYDQVYRQFYQMMGTPDSRIKSMASTFRNMLASIDGGIFYNLNSWYATVQLLPGYNLNQRFMENMMGVKSSVNIEKVSSLTFREKYLFEIPLLLVSAGKLVFYMLTIKRAIGKFIQNFYKVTDDYLNEDFAEYTNHQLAEVYDELFMEILFKWKAPITNDFKTMIFFGILGKMIKNLDIPHSDSLQNDLLIAQGDIASIRPTREIIKITDWIRKDGSLTEVFKKNSEKELISLILVGEDEQYNLIREKIKKYISEFGARSMYELKLEVDSIKEDPTFLFTLLKNYLNNKPVDLNSLIHKEEKKRAKAEEIVFDKFSGLKKHFFCWILKHTRMAIEDREELRFLRTKIFGIIRSLFTRIGRNFEKDGLISSYRDIFFLRTDEILELIEGRSIDKRSIRKRILLRKKDFSENEKKEHLERMYFYGSIYNDRFVEILSDSEVAMADELEDPDLFQGVACSPGVVQNKIKIIHSPHDATLNMEILVAKRTDPGWVPLFPSISGLIIERGSVLSHSAVVAREMGIPTIVGLRNITEKLKDNDIVRMDGSTGLVKRTV